MISQKFASVLATLKFDETGRLAPAKVWDELIAEASAFAVAEEQEAPWQNGGSDNSITFSFIDGSKLTVNNPRQSCFGGSWYAEGDDK